MIQIYLPSNTDYAKNGDCIIFPTACYTESILNGTWSLVLAMPIDEEGRWQFVVDHAVLDVPSFNGRQKYRIYKTDKTEAEVVAYAYPIFYDAMNDCFIPVCHPTEKNGQECLNLLCGYNNKYSGSSNIATISTAYYEYKNLLEAIASDDENSFINRWGGEILYNNFNVTINSRVGTDSGLTFRYGREINGIAEDIDTQNVVTRIYPKAYNGRTMTDNGYVDSTLIGNYPTIKSAMVEFSNIVLKEDANDTMLEDPEYTICEDQTELDAALTSACNAQFADGLDKPEVSVSISDLIDLSALEEYKGFSRQFCLGDTVTVYHPLLAISTVARVIYLKYDCIQECCTGLQLGNLQYNYFTSVNKTVNAISKSMNSDGSIKGDSISGRVDLKKASLYAQYTEADPVGKTAILFENNDLESEFYGAMAIGTQGWMISKEKNSDGTWNWTNIGNANGIDANAIVTGIISSRNMESYWDLDNSRLVFSDPSYKSSVILDEGYIALEWNGKTFGWIGRNVNYDGSPAFTLSAGFVKVWLNPMDESIMLRSSGDCYIAVNERRHYIDLSVGQQKIKIDASNNQISVKTNQLTMNDYTGYTGTATSGQTLTIKNGIITGVA